ncbi:hypothetical protein XA68_11336 [Ophiocordyceps unilateralis]|uniref:Hydrophobin n=1 Tax=Ophiocordyceps unilateralis TaxID=268505 RepID=A0A2A9PFB0_OPHUN|nr:hypothetical protein XA68_11336 [Ophiocordyceps unilateralis]
MKVPSLLVLVASVQTVLAGSEALKCGVCDKNLLAIIHDNAHCIVGAILPAVNQGITRTACPRNYLNCCFWSKKPKPMPSPSPTPTPTPTPTPQPIPPQRQYPYGQFAGFGQFGGNRGFGGGGGGNRGNSNNGGYNKRDWKA